MFYSKAYACCVLSRCLWIPHYDGTEDRGKQNQLVTTITTTATAATVAAGASFVYQLSKRKQYVHIDCDSLVISSHHLSSLYK